MFRRAAEAVSQLIPEQILNAADRRASRRTGVNGFSCDRGRVVDLSPTGLRLVTFSRWSEGQVRSISLADAQTKVELAARCMWCKPDSLLTHAVGLAFITPSAEEVQAIEELAIRYARLSDLLDTQPAGKDTTKSKAKAKRSAS